MRPLRGLQETRVAYTHLTYGCVKPLQVKYAREGGLWGRKVLLSSPL